MADVAQDTHETLLGISVGDAGHPRDGDRAARAGPRGHRPRRSHLRAGENRGADRTRRAAGLLRLADRQRAGGGCHPRGHPRRAARRRSSRSAVPRSSPPLPRSCSRSGCHSPRKDELAMPTDETSSPAPRRRSRRRRIRDGKAQRADARAERQDQAFEQGQQPLRRPRRLQAPPPAPAAPPADPTVEKINQLAQLHASGALTDEEFAAAKAQALGIG